MDNFTRLSGEALAQFAGQPVGDVAVFGLRLRQVSLETRAENSFHAGDPNT